ncbi:hypothetical protein MRQ36_20985 [Micromonospora sp. R77]|uniref:hypothetical protein n=1 Tax=Micromonospora sp. R77 TaxID=2925836 RepID=UPI001F60EB18|nr:hypothetical protein [Micromonospora sp. R77]MCI4064908.1 hypothetical protein [Micromonospora sp. R77]
MSALGRGDERFHYSDNSHRWIPPDPDQDQEVWEAMVRQHQQRHLDEVRSRRKERRTIPPDR